MDAYHETSLTNKNGAHHHRDLDPRSQELKPEAQPETEVFSDPSSCPRYQLTSLKPPLKIVKLKSEVQSQKDLGDPPYSWLGQPWGQPGQPHSWLSHPSTTFKAYTEGWAKAP